MEIDDKLLETIIRSSEIIGCFKKIHKLGYSVTGELLDELRDNYLPILLENRKLPQVRKIINTYKKTIEHFEFSLNENYNSGLPNK